MLKISCKKRRRRDFYRYLELEKPMVSISVSNKNLTATLHDATGRTIAGVSTIGKPELSSNIKSASLIGENLSEKIKNIGISEVVFNKSGLKFHGRIKRINEVLKANGIKC